MIVHMIKDPMANGHERVPTAQLLSPKDLAAYLGVPVATIYRWRSLGEGPVAYRVGRHVRYKREEIEEWLRGRTGVDSRR
jgi:excisionase family DNA binding protein